MSSEVKNKLSGYEVQPPAAVWDNIAAALDESGMANTFPALLRAAVIVPPAAAWNKITAVLDDNFFSADTAAKLYAMEATPPVAAWAVITKSLDTEKEAAIPEHRRFAPFVRYAAAAAVVGVMIWAGATLFSGKKETVEPIVSQPSSSEKITPANTTITAGTEQAVADVNAAIEEARNDSALEESKQVYASVDVNALQKKARSRSFSYVKNTDIISAPGIRGLGFPDPDEEVYFEPPIEADNYVVLMKPDGKFVRMSKKLGEFVCCIAGEEQDPNCIEQISRLQDKMVNRPLAHSPGNFMDLVSLVSSLDEK